MYSDSISCGSCRLPMMNSVEPPPISTTRRLCAAMGSMNAIHRGRSGGPSRPAVISMGKAERLLGQRQKLRRILATRKVLVATARTAPLSRPPRRLQPKRRRPSSARACEAVSRRLSAIRPEARRTGSFHRIQGVNLVINHPPTCGKAKLLEPRSTARAATVS